MEIIGIDAPFESELAAAYADFEKEFIYPLGENRQFRIDHGGNPWRFFQAMGEARVFLAIEEGKVLGSLGASIREARTPTNRGERVLYLGDLKTLPTAQRGRVLIGLLRALHEWGQPLVKRAFSLVMDGTSAAPRSYSGRLGIPEFEELYPFSVVRIDLSLPYLKQERRAIGIELSRKKSDFAVDGGWRLNAGDSAKRSKSQPLAFELAGGQASALLEDTSKAKRLIEHEGGEMPAAHLSWLAYDSPTALIELVECGAQLAAQQGFDFLFLALATPDCEALLRLWSGPAPLVAGAKVFGYGFTAGEAWRINTSEF